MIKKTIEELITKSLNETGVTEYNVKIELTPDGHKGDFTFNSFPLAKILRKNPKVIAETLAEKLKNYEIFEELETVQGYLNITVNREKLFSSVLDVILKDGLNYGSSDRYKGKKVMVEYSSPNTNKPQHLGHVRNNVLGMALSNILENAGYEVIRTNLINNRGIHICKSMLAYKKWGEGREPDIKGDHFVGNYYVLFEKKYDEEYREYLKENPGCNISKEDFFKISKLGQEAQKMLQMWEDGDKETIELWEKMNNWVIDGFMETYRLLGCTFDRIYLESNTYMMGKKIVLDALESGIVYRGDDGAVKIDLSEEGLGHKVLLRSDGTSVYMTQDIGTTVHKHEDYKTDLQFFVVGDEQNFHFKVLFSILKRLGYNFAAGCHHYSYGMINLPEGKMKSREGTVVDADELIFSLRNMVKDIMAGRDMENELEERALKLALAALKFMILKINPASTMIFNPKEAISFEGDTGPYLLYVYVRCQHILARAGSVNFEAINYKRLGNEEEVALVKHLSYFPELCLAVASDYNLSVLAGYLLNLGKKFHRFYHLHDVLHQDDSGLMIARLALIKCVRDVISRGLKLLFIDTVEEM